MKRDIILKYLVSGAWTEEERCDTKGPRIEEEILILKHLVSGAWTEEDRSDMKGPCTEEERIS